MKLMMSKLAVFVVDNSHINGVGDSHDNVVNDSHENVIVVDCHDNVVISR